MKRFLLGSFLLVAISTPAQADVGNIFLCDDRRFVLQRCRVAQTPVKPAPTDDGSPFEAEYLVTYDFPCSGHRANVGLRAGDGAPVTLSQGVIGGTVSVIGKGDLVPYDPAPESTARLSFHPGCTLVVKSVVATPSNDTIVGWTNEAKNKARILSMARDIYVLSRDFASVATFNRTQLGVVIDATQARVNASTGPLERRRWRSLLDSLIAMRDAQPLPVPKAEVDTYLAELASNARADLLAEVDSARAVANRFTTWSLEVERTLRDVLESVPTI